MNAPDRLSFPELDERPDRRKPWRVRWFLNGTEHNLSFARKPLADQFRGELMKVASSGGRWDSRTGLPVTGPEGTIHLHEWARTYVADRQEALAPNSRRTDAWTLTYMVERASTPLSTEHRRALLNWLIGTHELPAALTRWSRSVPSLRDLDRTALYQLERAMRQGVKGAPLTPRLAARQVATVRRCLNEAARRGIVEPLDWAPSERAGRRKSDHAHTARSTTTVMSQVDASALLNAMSGLYRQMTAIALYAGLRPAEVVALEGDDIDLATRRIHVRRAWNGAGREWGSEDEDVGATKTSVERWVPIADVLAGELPSPLRAGPFIRTRTGTRPSQTNWRRAIRVAAERAGVVAPTPYECRHFFISHLVRQVPIATAATIAGHSPDVLVRYYLHEIEGAATDLSALFS